MAISPPISRYFQSSSRANGYRRWDGGEHHCSCKDPIPRGFFQFETISSRLSEKRGCCWTRRIWISTLWGWSPAQAVRRTAGTAIRLWMAPMRGSAARGLNMPPSVPWGPSSAMRTLKAPFMPLSFATDTASIPSRPDRYISWAMELYQRGIINDSQVGYPLQWGDQEAIIKLIGQIAKREGFGDVLAEGPFASGTLARGPKNSF